MQALMAGKSLLRPKEFTDKLHQVNGRETGVLQGLMTSPEALEAVMKFLERKSKL